MNKDKIEEIKSLCELKIEAIYDLLKDCDKDIKDYVVNYWEQHMSKLDFQLNIPKIGYCQTKPRNLRYLYIDNVRDHIKYILKFIKECTGIEYTFGIYRSEILNSDTDCYSFFNVEDDSTLFYVEDTDNYIIFDEDNNEFEIYSVDGFNDSFKLVNRKEG